jgi:two-component system, NarL family, sensor histidine kinase YdfH
VLQQALGRARETLADARRAIGDLREEPDPVTDLPGAILEEIERFRSLTGIPCDASLDRTCVTPEELRETALRAAAEGLFNIARHAGATHAAVELKCTPKGLHLTVVDDGKGFDPEQFIGQNGHYGLLGLRERCRLAGGTLTITSRPGEGTRLELALPNVESK